MFLDFTGHMIITQVEGHGELANIQDALAHRLSCFVSRVDPDRNTDKSIFRLWMPRKRNHARRSEDVNKNSRKLDQIVDPIEVVIRRPR